MDKNELVVGKKYKIHSYKHNHKIQITKTKQQNNFSGRTAGNGRDNHYGYWLWRIGRLYY